MDELRVFQAIMFNTARENRIARVAPFVTLTMPAYAIFEVISTTRSKPNGCKPLTPDSTGDSTPSTPVADCSLQILESATPMHSVPVQAHFFIATHSDSVFWLGQYWPCP